MDIRLPKPIHGWRAFLGEVGIIVLGVLLALGAQKAAENWSWRDQVHDAKDDLRTELAEDLFNAQERVVMEQCINRRLDDISALIDHPPARPWKFLPGHNLTPTRVWPTSAWDSAIASGAVTHMSRKERVQYGDVYAFVRGLHALVLDELAVSIEFRMMEHGGPLSEADQDRLRADVSKMQGYNTILALGGAQLSQNIRALGIEMSPEQQRELTGRKCDLPSDVLRNSSS